MMLMENIRLALTGLKANKMRALLTMLGIIIGISSVIAIMTVGNSLTATLNDSFSSMGASNISVMVTRKMSEDDFSTGGPRNDKAPTDDDYITSEMIDAYIEKYEDKIDALCATTQLGSTKVEIGNLYANLSVIGANYGALADADNDLLAGRYFTDDEMVNARSVCLVSDYTVDNLYAGDNEKALGSVITVGIGDKYYPFTIVGIYKYEQSEFSFETVSKKNTTTMMYIPIRTAKRIDHTSNYSQFDVKPALNVDATEFSSETQEFFNGFYETNENYEIMAYTMASLVESMAASMTAVTAAISVIAGIALLVGGIGVMNIMLVSITERTREIGTRKALGAPNSSIRMQFIVESIVICIIGGIIGIILGIAMGFGACKLMEDTKPVISGMSIIISMSFSLAIGVFFGYYPANKAAKMDPIEALRYE